MCAPLYGLEWGSWSTLERPWEIAVAWIEKESGATCGALLANGIFLWFAYTRSLWLFIMSSSPGDVAVPALAGARFANNMCMAGHDEVARASSTLGAHCWLLFHAVCASASLSFFIDVLDGIRARRTAGRRYPSYGIDCSGDEGSCRCARDGNQRTRRDSKSGEEEEEEEEASIASIIETALSVYGDRFVWPSAR